MLLFFDIIRIGERGLGMIARPLNDDVRAPTRPGLVPPGLLGGRSAAASLPPWSLPPLLLRLRDRRLDRATAASLALRTTDLSADAWHGKAQGRAGKGSRRGVEARGVWRWGGSLARV